MKALSSAFTPAYSAYGSVLAHLVPLIIIILEQSHDLGTIEASMMTSTLLAGVFSGILVTSRLPWTKIGRAFVLWLLLGQAGTYAIILLLPEYFWYPFWFILGIFSGTLVQTGSCIIASSPISSQLYLLRVTLTLFFSGILCIAVYLSGRPELTSFVFFNILFLCIFIALFYGANQGLDPETTHKFGKKSGENSNLSGLLIILLFFVGQIAFISQIAKNMPIGPENVMDFAYYLGFAKLFSALGCWCLYKANFSGSDKKIMTAAVLMAMAIGTLSLSQNGFLFVILFFSYDIAFCVFASGLLGRVALNNYGGKKALVMISCQAGTMLGPAFGGWLIVKFGSLMLTTTALLTTLMAAFWIWIVSRRNGGGIFQSASI